MSKLIIECQEMECLMANFPDYYLIISMLKTSSGTHFGKNLDYVIFTRLLDNKLRMYQVIEFAKRVIHASSF